MIFRDKVIWITGASSGIGEALAYAFNREGAKLILSSRRKHELLRVQQNCIHHLENVHVLPLDLSKINTLAAKAKKALELYGRINILINNGGVSQRSLVMETDLSVYQTIMNINYFGTIALTKAVLPSMVERKSGHIVVISSVLGKLSTPRVSGYAASKHALHGFFDGLRAEIRRSNIKVTIVCPGYIHTNVSINALTGDGTKLGIMDDNHVGAMSAEKCAKGIVKAIRKGKEEFIFLLSGRHR